MLVLKTWTKGQRLYRQGLSSLEKMSACRACALGSCCHTRYLFLPTTTRPEWQDTARQSPLSPRPRTPPLLSSFSSHCLSVPLNDELPMQVAIPESQTGSRTTCIQTSAFVCFHPAHSIATCHPARFSLRYCKMLTLLFGCVTVAQGFVESYSPPCMSPVSRTTLQ